MKRFTITTRNISETGIKGERMEITDNQTGKKYLLPQDYTGYQLLKLLNEL